VLYVCADDWGEKPKLPDGTSPGLAVITEGELRRHDAGPKHPSDQLSTASKQLRRQWFDGLLGALNAGSRRDVVDKRGPQSCISNCLETDNMTFVRCRFLCKWTSCWLFPPQFSLGLHQNYLQLNPQLKHYSTNWRLFYWNHPETFCLHYM